MSTELNVESYVRRIDLTDAIRQNLNDYPLGSGIIRELIQNSDDAGATNQILVLDHRSFGRSTLCDPVLARYQGPALLAFNDAKFIELDWISLMTISNSKKKDDVTKAGKFGLGFNAVHHITDAPSVISDRHLAVLDPHEDLARNPGGAKLDFVAQAHLLGDQLSAFSSLMENPSSPVEGTIVRLPLRTAEDASRSRIKQEETSVTSIRDLMLTFIQNELNIALLFLKHLKSIVLREVLETGTVRFLASAELLGISGPRVCLKSDDVNTYQSSVLKVQCLYQRRRETSDWLVRHEVSNVESVGACLAGGVSKTVNMLKEEKLYPHIAIALPLSSNATVTGRLFTYLPLPIETGFPVHVHALFALTSDRQSLRNSREKAQSGSREHILQSWNAHLFKELIPDIWASVLEDAKTHVKSIYTFWPPQSGATDWKRIDVEVFKKVFNHELPIWPSHTTDVSSTPQFLRFDDGLVDVSDTDPNLLRVIAKTKLDVIKPPPHVVQSIKDTRLNLGSSYTTLSPITVSQRIKATGTTTCVENLLPNEKIVLLEYLYDPRSCNRLLGIPVIPLINGSFASIQPAPKNRPFKSVSVYFASANEILLFRDLESRFLDRSRIEKVLKLGPNSASVTILNPNPAFIGQTDAVKFGIKHGCQLVNNALLHNPPVGAEWLSKIHDWADSHYRQLRSIPGVHSDIDQLPLPLIGGSTVPAYSSPPIPPIMDSRDLQEETIKMFRQLGIPLLHKSFTPTQYLQKWRRVSTAFDAEAVLGWLEIRGISATNDTLGIRPALHHHLSRVLHAGSNVSVLQGRMIRKMPIFLAYEPEGSGRLSRSYKAFGEEPIYIMGSSLDIIPHLPRHTFLDFSQDSNTQLIRLLDPKATPITALQLAQLAADKLGSQPECLVDRVFERLVLPHIYDLFVQHPVSFERLRRSSFITTHTGRRAPSLLVDPEVDIRKLFGDDDPALPIGFYAQSNVLNQLRGVKFFRGSISSDMVDERIKNYASSDASPEVIRCAQRLMDTLDKSSIDIDFPISIQQKRWIPIQGQLFPANECRDESQRHLVSRVLYIIPRCLQNARLHEALGWSTDVPNDILRQQFLKLVHEPDSQDKIGSLRKLLPVIYGQFTYSEIQVLRTATGDRPWIPIGNRLRPRHSVYVSEDVRDLEPSFVKLPDLLREFSQFFVQMGVPTLPPPDDLIQELHDLARDSSSPTIRRLDRCINILETICMTELPDELYPSILVPNTAEDLCSISDVIFDDRGQSQSGFNPLDNYVHPRVSPHLATLLRIPKTSSRMIDGLTEDDAFGDYEQYETIQNKIRQTLLSYSYLSTCNEILANADDARATEVSVMYDRRKFSETGALSPALQDIHSGPALVFHNNSVFTASDWDGLQKVGSGGKSGRDSIGRFGLGALTFFHWTDVPLIVSGNYAVFLDPSGEYLPTTEAGRPRRGLKISLRHCDDGRFDGTFQPLSGLFGFQLREYYDGTLIRLPLRQSSSKLLNSTYTAPDVGKFLQQCEDDASMAFLFTRCLESISVRQSGRDGSTSTTLRTTGVRRNGLDIPAPDYPGTLGSITSLQVTVTQMPRNIEQQFLVVKSTIPVESLPSDPPIRQCAQKHRLSSPSIGLAYLIGANTAFKKGKMRLMSTFGLGVTELPVHLHGEFILSTDRKSIIMDKMFSTSLETQYNEFLLGKLGPPLYLYLIHVCLTKGYPTSVLWPPVEPSITETLVREMYKLLPEFPGVLFKTASNSTSTSLIAPRDAVFNGAPQFTSFLRRIGVPNLVISHRLSRECAPTLQFDDAAWMAAFLKDKGDGLQHIFEDDSYSKRFVGDLISHIVDGLGTQGLHGLRLLPTTMLHIFERSADSTNEPFLVTSSTEDYLFYFSKHRFLVREYLGEEVVGKLLEAGVGLNMRKFSPTVDVSTVMEQAFPAFQGLMHISSMKIIPDERWLSAFSDYITENKVLVDSLRSFTFIPLFRPEGYYISAESSSSLFAVEQPSRWQLDAVLQLTGFHIFAHWSALPPGLIPEPEPFHVSHFLRWLQLDNHVGLWTSLDIATQRTLIPVIKMQAQNENVIASLTSTSPLAGLPLWECPRSNGTVDLKAALDIVVLPSFANAAPINPRFLNRLKSFISLEGRLREVAKALGATVLNGVRDLGSFLLLPERLDASDVEQFRDFLSTLLRNPHDFGNLKFAPDGYLNLRHASELFHPVIDVFRCSLDPPQLLHQEFLRLADALTASGLKAELNFQNLEECARTVDRHVDNVRERAESVYEALSSTRIQVHEYTHLEHLAFIPRQPNDVGPLWRRDYLPVFPEVVAPVKLLLQEHTSIAWTQRAQFSTQPSPALCTRWPSLGRPHIGEVVQHLVVLATEIAGYVENAYAWGNDFINDLRETYSYLQQEDSEAVREALLNYRTTAIFLNIDDSQSRPWVWASADSLVLDINDNSPAHTRNFLASHYIALLHTAGVRRLKPVDLGGIEIPDDSATYPQRLLKGMRELLVGGQGTDVTLVATTEEGYDRTLRAHKVIMAATSDWFRDKIFGGYLDGETAELDVTLRTLQAIVDYFYGRNPIPEWGQMDEDGEVEYINTLLEILVAADRYMLTDLKRTAEIHVLVENGRFIRPGTVIDILDHAKLAHSDVVAEVCQKFMEDNASFM